jgi:acetyl-CoA synthetase
VPEGIYFVSKLPKTRSGKIMRRLLKSIANREDSIGDLTTLEDSTSVEEIKHAFNELKKKIVE